MRTHHGDIRDLFLGFRVALDPRKMLLGMGGLCFSGTGLAVLGWLGAQAGLSGAEADLLGQRLAQGDLADSSRFIGIGVTRVFCGGTPEPLIPGTAGFLAFAGFLWWILVWSFFGGAIARIAAVEVARDQRLTANEAMQFARERFGSFFWGPTGVVVMITALLGCNALLGLAGKIPVAGDLLVALTFPLVLVFSLIALLLGTGAVISSPLFGPALATEATDGFDAVSRSLSYLFSRPWRYVWYGLVAKVYGGICCGVVAVFGWGVVALSLHSLGVGRHAGEGSNRMMERVAEYLHGPMRAGEGPITMSDFMTEFGATSVVPLVVMTVMVLLVFGLVAGFMVSMRYSLATCAYFLLRHKVDATEMDEVWVPEAEREEPPVPLVEGPPAETEDQSAPADAPVPPAEGGDAPASE